MFVLAYRQNLINGLLAIVQAPLALRAKVHGKTHVAGINILSKKLHNKSQCGAIFDNGIPHYDTTIAQHCVT
jgi:hypothetical protein